MKDIWLIDWLIVLNIATINFSLIQIRFIVGHSAHHHRSFLLVLNKFSSDSVHINFEFNLSSTNCIYRTRNLTELINPALFSVFLVLERQFFSFFLVTDTEYNKIYFCHMRHSYKDMTRNVNFSGKFFS